MSQGPTCALDLTVMLSSGLPSKNQTQAVLRLRDCCGDSVQPQVTSFKSAPKIRVSTRLQDTEHKVQVTGPEPHLSATEGMARGTQRKGPGFPDGRTFSAAGSEE